MTASAPTVTETSPATSPRFTFRQRVVLWLITYVGSLAVRLVCSTLRYENSADPGGPLDANERPIVWAFWHRCLIVATHRFAKRDIAVLTSRSFDGECISRVIEKFGYKAVRGSSTRGGVGAVLGAKKEIELHRRAVAFTVDGPLGPPFLAKPGPILLARTTGTPIIAFHIALQSAWTLPTWDGMVIPRPFSRAVVHFSAPMHVPTDADQAKMDRQLADLQSTLEHVRECAEAAASTTRRH